ADARSQHKARFIQKNEVSFAFLGGTSNLRKPLRLPVQNGLFVSLTSPPARLLRRPAQTLTQETADVVVMIVDLKMTKNHLANARCCPKFVWPTVSLGSLGQKRFQLP